MKRKFSLKIENLEAGYGGATVLHGLNLEIQGKAVGVVGRNGMGKSTFCLSLMNMGPVVTAGTVIWEGQNILGLAPHQICKRGIAVVPQGRRVFPSLSVEEHLRIAETPKSKWNLERVYGVFPRLEERSRNRGDNLSGGEQQMLAIGRALMTNPRLMILDEPSEGLSPLVVQEMVEMINGLEEEGIQIIVVEQNLRIAAAIAQTILVMSSGQFVASHPSKELLGSRTLQQSLLGV
jgi:branched-chain amino acid transport system ATP-binding protein